MDQSLSIVPVSHDPWAPQPLRVVPVDHDPFAQAGAMMPQPLPASAQVGPPEGTTWASLGAAVPKVAAGLASPVIGAAEQTRDALQGIDPLRNPDAAVKGMTDATMMLAGTGMPMAEAGAAGVFGGKLAKTADLSALETAQALAAKGANPAHIWDATGWFQGADKQWRFEIQDPGHLPMNPWSPTIGGAINHSGLFAAYPDIANIRSVLGDQRGGSYSHSLTANNRPVNEVIRAGGQKGDIQSTILHELQHAIQAREGFAPGGNQYDMLKSGVEALAAKRGRPLTPDEQEQIFQSPIGFNLYRRLAGEVEARNVSKRWGGDPTIPPWGTEDTLPSRQIVR